MGEYLRTWSEIEYTNAGEVMQNVGKLQESINGIRYVYSVSYTDGHVTLFDTVESLSIYIQVEYGPCTYANVQRVHGVSEHCSS